LTFAPLAWLKLQYFCHAAPTEIGGFGITAENDLLHVLEFVTVRQRVSAVTVRFDDQAIADFFDQSIDRGLRMEQFARIWMHTHPGDSVEPSTVDEATFARSFGSCHWALMFILGRTGRTYARLTMRVGPGASLELPTAVDWSAWPTCLAQGKELLQTEMAQWQREYEQNIDMRPEHPLALAMAEPVADDRFLHEIWENYPYQSELDEVTYGLTEPDYFFASADRDPPF